MPEIIGIAPGARITRGQFFRATWILNAWSILLHKQLEVLVFGETYNKIARTGLVAPVSDLEVTAGDKSMVVDILVLQGGNGLTVSMLAAVLDELRISLRLDSLELITQREVQDAGGRAATQELANAEKDADNWWAKFEAQLKYVKWIAYALILALLLYAASPAIAEVRK